MSPQAIYPLLQLKLPQASFTGFASLLQHGVLFPLHEQLTLRTFLLSLPGFTPEYIEKNVQTIFVDGVATDNLDRDLTDGSTVALSAAMPGLAGAIFRRQGIHKTLRSQPDPNEPAPHANGFLTLKLFNSIATDRVEGCLRQGVLISGQALADFGRSHEELFATAACLQLDGQPVDAADLMARVPTLEKLTFQAIC